MKDQAEPKSKNRFYFIVALLLALVLSGGAYVYTYSTGIQTINITEPTADIATANATETQPDWEEVLETEVDTETLRPNAAGTYSQCDAVGDSPNYACVDESSPDEDSTYVRTWGGATELDTYNIDDHSEGTGNVTAVTVYIRPRATSGTHAAEVVLRTNGGDFFGSYTSPVPTTYGDIGALWGTNPSTTNPWTWDEIDALEIGVRHYDLNGGYLQTTQVYTEIEYEYLPISGDVPAGDLFEIYENPDYSGDLVVRAYLANSGNLSKAFQSLNMQLYLEDSVEAGETPNYRWLTLDNGLATFTLKDPVSDNHTLSVIGGDYTLISDTPADWEEGWTVTPELYCEVTQR